MTTDDPRLTEARRHIDYYETVVVYCADCGKEWSTGWSDLVETQQSAAEHWIETHAGETP